MASPPSSSQILSLYRSLLRVSRKFSDYNIRSYTKTKTTDTFHQNKDLTDASLISSAYQDGINQLEIANRQCVVYSLYEPRVKSVMDIKAP